MKLRFALVLGTLALVAAACSGGVATSNLPVTGEVCGVTALAGGPPSAVGVKDHALLHVCPSGPHKVTSEFRIMAKSGRRYEVYSYNHGGWEARVPTGTYRAVGAAGCPSVESPFVVTAGKVRVGVVVWIGCLWS